MNFVNCFEWIFMSTLDENCLRTGTCLRKQNARIEVKALIDTCSNVQILWIEAIILGVFFNKIRAYCMTIPNDSTIVIQCWHRVLWIHLKQNQCLCACVCVLIVTKILCAPGATHFQIFRFQMFARIDIHCSGN